MGSVRAAARVVAPRRARRRPAIRRPRPPPRRASAGRRPSRQLVARGERAVVGAREWRGAARDGGSAAAGGTRRAATALVDALRCGLWPSAPLLTYAAHGARARLLEPAALVDGVGVQLREVLAQLAQLAAGDGAAVAARRCEALLTLAAAVLPCALIDGDGDSDGDGDAQPRAAAPLPSAAAAPPRVHPRVAGVWWRAAVAPRRRHRRRRPPKRGDLERCRFTPSASPPGGARASGICSATPSATPRRAVTRRARCVRVWAAARRWRRGGAAVRAAGAHRTLLRRSLPPMPPARQRRAPLELLTGGAVWRALEASHATSPPLPAPAATTAAAMVDVAAAAPS